MVAHASRLRFKSSLANRRLALLHCVAPHQLALCDDMIFHRGIHLAALCATAQIQFAIESENLERISMRARRRTRTLIIWFAKIICAVHPFRRAAFRNWIDPWRDIPDQPMSKHSTRRVRIICNQNKTFCFWRNTGYLQRRASVGPGTCEFWWDITTLLESRARDFQSCCLCREWNDRRE